MNTVGNTYAKLPVANLRSNVQQCKEKKGTHRWWGSGNVFEQKGRINLQRHVYRCEQLGVGYTNILPAIQPPTK